MKKNIILYFTDQQRWDTIGVYGQKLEITPFLDSLANEGTIFDNAYSPQPVCGPFRSMLQSGLYPTTTGCFKNNIMLPHDIKTLANYMDDAGYENAYVGKWHLASLGPSYGQFIHNYETTAIPLEFRGGYKGFWRASDVLEATSHGYGGFIFDENGNKIEFDGYRVDAITNFGIEFIENYDSEKPFFLTISHIEPHHQNDHNTYEGPIGSKERFKDFELPKDLVELSHPESDAYEEYPDYLGQCRSLDDNLNRLVNKLKEKGIYENTVIIYFSDHGSHFKTRNRDENRNGGDDYKRSAHSSASHVPLIIHGPGFNTGKRIEDVVSTASLPKTILSIAGIEVGKKMVGEDLTILINNEEMTRDEVAFIQISESRVGRAIRTPKYLYAVVAPDKNGFDFMDSDVYKDDFLYDIEKDPYEINNLVDDSNYKSIILELRKILVKEMKKIGEKEPKFI